MIPDRISIDERPLTALNRAEPGHCEYDSVVSSKRSGGAAALAVLIERSSRLTRATLVPNLKPKPYAAVIATLAGGFTARSLTTDNGIENKQHRLTTELFPGCPPVFFIDPYCSWQNSQLYYIKSLYIILGVSAVYSSAMLCTECLLNNGQLPREGIGLGVVILSPLNLASGGLVCMLHI